MSAPVATALQEDLTLLVRPSEAAGHHGLLSYGWGFGVAALILGLCYAAFRLAGRGAARQEPVEDPGSAALRELDLWKELKEPGRFREAVGAVSDTIRRYVDKRFGLGAPRMTTEEFFEAIARDKPISVRYDPFWARFMEGCDRVKYAGFVPDSGGFGELLAAARNFVTDTTGFKKDTRP